MRARLRKIEIVRKRKQNQSLQVNEKKNYKRNGDEMDEVCLIGIIYRSYKYEFDPFDAIKK